jgi:hypothetical protein
MAPPSSATPTIVVSSLEAVCREATLQSASIVSVESTSSELDGTVIVAVVPVRMVKVAVHQIIDVVSVRDGLVTAAGPMHVTGSMSRAAMVWRAAVGVTFRDGNHMLVDVAVVRVVKVTIMKIVDVTVMANGDVSTLGPVLMGVRSSWRCFHGWPP